MAWEVVSSDVRRAMGVSSDVRGLEGAMGVALAMPEAWEVMSEEQWVCLVTSED